MRQNSSHRLNGNLTGLDRNSLTLVSEVFKEGGKAPLRRFATQIAPIPAERKFSQALRMRAAARGALKLQQNELSKFCSRIKETKDSETNNQILYCLGIGEIGKANRRKGQRPFSNSLSKRASASFCLGASNCRSDGGLIIGARCARIDIRKHCAPIIKRRINGDFTRQAGVGKIGNANFSEGGKTPCFIYKTYRRSLGFAASCRRLSGEGRRITHTQNLRL